MRVLWFTNTPALASNHLNLKVTGGSWIESLEAELAKNPSIQLGICFNIKNSQFKKFDSNNTSYFPVNIKYPKNKFKQLILRWTHSIKFENNVHTYLRIIEEFKPDIINIFGTESSFGLIIPKTKVPCIIHIQGNLNIYDHKFFVGLSEIDILRYSKKIQLLLGYGYLHDYLRNKKAAAREREIFRDCKYFMGRTDWDKRICRVFSPNSTYFHCEEIMRPAFYFHKWMPKNRQNECIILSTIRKNKYKGLETIYESNKILKEENPKFKITWKIAGVGENDEIISLLKKKYRLKEENIQLLGILQENDLIQEMLEADLFLHPSHIDNSPNGLCEAMLLGMPIIATFVGGIPSILCNKKEGLLFQDGDPFSLAGAIIELIENIDYANNLAKNARQRALNRHDPKKIVNNLLEIYSSII